MQDQVQRNENDIAEVGRRIRERREELNLNQEDLADRMGCMRNDVYRHETGRHEMKISTLFMYAEALQTDPQRLCPDRFFHDPDSERLAPVLNILSQLSDESLNVVAAGAARMLELEKSMHQI